MDTFGSTRKLMARLLTPLPPTWAPEPCQFWGFQNHANKSVQRWGAYFGTILERSVGTQIGEHV